MRVYAFSCFDDNGYERAGGSFYVPNLAEKITLQRMNDFSLGGSVDGRLVQSIALDRVECNWVAAISLSKTPESVMLVEVPRLSSRRDYRVYQSDTLFSHPQDISASTWERGALFWLPSQNRKGVVAFTLGEGNIKEEFAFDFFRTPIKGLSTAVDAKGENLVVQGYFRQGKSKERKQMVRVYALRDLLNGESALRSRDIKPRYEWALDESQQDSRQWRQGMAIYGNSLFVLSGNAKPSQEKLLVSYELSGRVLSVDILPDSMVGSFKARKSKTFEPEGLEIVSYKGEVGVGVGLAGGTKSARSYELWFVPLKKIRRE